MNVIQSFNSRLRFFVLLSFIFCLSNTQLIAQDSLFVKLIGEYKPPGSVMGVDVKGNYAYVVSDFGIEDSLFIIDVSDPTNPVRVGERKTLSALSIDVVGNFAYTGGSKIEVWDITDPLNPFKTDELAAGNLLSIFVSGSIAFITTTGQFVNSFDVSDPTNISKIGNTLDLGSGPVNDVYVDGALAYVVNEDNGMFVVDVGDLLNKIIVDTVLTPGVASGIFVADDRAYVADGANGLSIIDVINPPNPAETGNYNTLGFAKDVVVDGNFAYVADDILGMRVIYVSDNANPAELGYYDPGGQSEDIVFTNNLIYVADRAKGLVIYRKMMVEVGLRRESFTGVPIPITVSDLTGLGISGIEFVLKYDSTLIDTGAVVFIDNTSLLSGTNWTMVFNPSTPGSTAIALTGTDELTGADTLFNIILKGKSGIERGSQTELSFGRAMFNEGSDVLAIAEPVQITVGFPFGDITGNGEVTAFDASFVFRHALGLITLNEQQQKVADVSGDSLITEFDVSLILQFVVGLIDLFPVEQSAKPSFAASGSLEINDIAISETERFSLPVMISGVEGVFSGSFEVEYDRELFMLENVEAGELTENFLIGINTEGSVERVIFAGSKEINTSGALVELLFSIRTDFSGESAIIIRPIRLNINNIHGEEDSAVVSKFVTSLDNDVVLPEEFVLEQNYPNPFNPSTDLKFYLPEAASIRLDIIDLQGQVVNILQEDEMAPGWHSVVWNGDNFKGFSAGSGIYLYRLVGRTTGEEVFSVTKKMVLLK